MCLTLEERGAYTTLLDTLYDRGSPLKEDEKCSLAILESASENAAQFPVLLSAKVRFFELMTAASATADLKLRMKTYRKLLKNALRTGRKVDVKELRILKNQ